MLIRPQPAAKWIWKLDESGTCTYDSNGNGTITLAPGGAKERWVIHFTAVSSTQLTTNNIPSMVMYRGSAVPGNQLGGTFSALADSDTDEILLNMNEGVVYVFSKGDPGAQGSVHIEGVRYVWGT